MHRFLIISTALAAVLTAAAAGAQSSQHGGGGHGGGTSHAGGSNSSGSNGGGRSPATGSPHAGQWQSHVPAGHREFHGRAFNTLTPLERQRWVGGAWRHEWHNGVFGWWWFVGDDWFFYAEPIYPYPTYIAPILGVQEAPPAPPPQPVWYYCTNPEGYYPYVTACPGGWARVPAEPQDAPPPR